MKKITTEQFKDLDLKLCDLHFSLDCLERNKEKMSFEDYMRERSLIMHKIECHNARVSGKWNNVPQTETYKNENNGKR